MVGIHFMVQYTYYYNNHTNLSVVVINDYSWVGLNKNSPSGLYVKLDQIININVAKQLT